MSKQEELIQALAEKWAIVHKSTCNLSQNWFEAEQALADTPEKFRDESWQMAYEEMREKKNTCTCGVKKLLISDLRTLISQIVPGEEELIGIMNRYQSRPLFEDAEVLDPMDFHKVAKDVINRLTGKE
jgi:hypothetical protein